MALCNKGSHKRYIITIISIPYFDAMQEKQVYTDVPSFVSLFPFMIYSNHENERNLSSVIINPNQLGGG